ncbi:Lrp/AsnC family transcriptional regulator [archaeon]|jgi:DNA-binding Lrp family transcriptional regulator|nr:Lrp/AsnC family transcriptional regulator [archaeon]MBT4416685.1 Lrp/AsnC family transcriptional regulator [archaeon]
MQKEKLLILSLLRENARTPLTKISKKTRVPISTLHEIVKNDMKGMIQKTTILLDYDKMGYSARANMLIKVKKDKRVSLKNYLKKLPHTNNIQSISNGYDFMAEFIFRDFKKMELFFEELEDKFEILDKKKFYIMEEIKREGFVDSFDYLKLGDENGKL